MTSAVQSGLALFYHGLSAEELLALWQAAFTKSNPALCFNGMIAAYTLSKTVIERTDFKASLSGNAFNSQLELRWRQTAPDCFEAMVLLEDAGLAKQLPLTNNTQEFEVSKGRQSKAVIQIPDANFNKVERRLPYPPRYPEKEPPKVSYQYYLDGKTKQVQYIRLVAGE